jgi:hypothetical protein
MTTAKKMLKKEKTSEYHTTKPIGLRFGFVHENK